MPLNVWRDFSSLLGIFGAQNVTVKIHPQVQINPDTNEEYYTGTETTHTIAAVVVPALSLQGSDVAQGEFLPQGVIERADYILFTQRVILDETGQEVNVTVADGRNHPAEVVIDGKTYAVIKDQKWDAANMRALVVSTVLPGPPL